MTNTAEIISYDEGSDIIGDYLQKMNARLELSEYKQIFGQQDLAELRKVAAVFEGLMKHLPEGHEILVIQAEEFNAFGEESSTYFENNEVSLDGTEIDEYIEPKAVKKGHIEYSEDADEAVTRIVELASMFYEQKSPFGFKMIVSKEKASIEMKIKIVQYETLSV